jgi:hypothetical protein
LELGEVLGGVADLEETGSAIEDYKTIMMVRGVMRLRETDS